MRKFERFDASNRWNGGLALRGSLRLGGASYSLVPLRLSLIFVFRLHLPLSIQNAILQRRH